MKNEYETHTHTHIYIMSNMVYYFDKLYIIYRMMFEKPTYIHNIQNELTFCDNNTFLDFNF